MDILDDNGRLFGAVNIIDLLVVLLVVAVGVAGAALVLSDDPAPEPTTLDSTYATVDFGTHAPNVASAINEGDTYSPGGDSEIKITDVYVTPEGNQYRVISRVKLTGPAGGSLPTYDGAPPRLGRQVALATDLYKMNGRIQAVGDQNSLPASQSQALISDRLSAATADEIAAGDEIKAGGRTVATVESKQTYPTNDPNTQQVFLGVNVSTYRENGDQYFGSTPLRVGQQIRLPASEYTVTGQIERVGTLTLPGTPATKTVVLRKANVHTSIAQALEGGKSEQAGETTTATVTDVTTEPTVVLIRGDDGTLGVYDHPTQRNVMITADVGVRETPSGILYKGQPLQQGSEISVDLGSMTVRATVVDIR